MGKKSRRKGGSSTKQKSDRNLNNEPSEETQGAVVQPQQPTYFVGDRVWLLGKTDLNPNSRRGIIREILPGDSYDVVTLQSIIDGDTVPFTCSKDLLCPDFCDITLRFAIGDRIIFNDAHQNLWTSGTVDYLWPSDELRQMHKLPATATDLMIAYRIKTDFNRTGYAFYDNDSCIQSRPTSFRLKVGDQVVFHPTKAQPTSGRGKSFLQRSSAWIRGVVTAVDVSRQGVDYAAYECTFLVGTKNESCRVFRDDDEHIAHVDVDPRKRLFDAIEHNCSRQHLRHLTKTFKIEVGTFSDLVVAKAIECASYQACLWLQLDCKVDLFRMIDEDGNCILHMIAKSSNASCFIKEAGEMNQSKVNNHKESLNLVQFVGTSYNLSTELHNKDGEFWLQILVKRGDVIALDAALSPHYGLGWKLSRHYCFGDQNLKLLQTSINEANNPSMQYVFDSFQSFRTLYRQFEALPNRDGEDKEMIAVFEGESAEYHAKLLSRFYLDWRHHKSKNVDFFVIQRLAREGSFHLLRLLYEADSTIFYGVCSTQSLEDKNEFIQPELRSPIQEKERIFNVDTINMCIVGYRYIQPIGKDVDWEFYFREVKVHFLKCNKDCPSLQGHLRRRNLHKPSCLYQHTEHFRKRLALIEDDDDVDGREKVLEYLLYKNSEAQVDILFAMKQRQCWVVRFMVEKSRVDIQSRASTSDCLVRNAQSLIFLDSGRIPSKLTTKCCLCFAAIQYDDSQSLQFLCESFGAPDELVNGWNLLHFAAYLGRVEIVGWLSTQFVWNSLVSKPCTRHDFKGAFAHHIAIFRGHLHLCQLLVQLDNKGSGLGNVYSCASSTLREALHLDTYKDMQGEVLDNYARNSEHEFVRKLAADVSKDRSKHADLVRDIRKLLDITEDDSIKPDQVKDFIIASECLDVKRWEELRCYKFDTVSATMGYSFRDVLNKFCKRAEIELASWLCVRLYRDEKRNYCSFWDQVTKEDEVKNVSRDDLVSLAREWGFNDLLIYLEKKLFQDICCEDPLVFNCLLESAFGEDDRVLEARAEIIRLSALTRVAHISRNTIAELFSRGGHAGKIRELANIITSVKKSVDGSKIKHCLVDMEMNFCNQRSSYIDYEDDHPLLRQFWCDGRSKYDRHSLHIVLVTEGYSELLQFCLGNLEGWTVTMELEVVQIASFFGKSDILDTFLKPGHESITRYLSTEEGRHNAAILGAVEGLRHHDVKALVKQYGAPSDPIKGECNRSEKVPFDVLTKSPLILVLNAYASNQNDNGSDSKIELKTLRYLVKTVTYSHEEILTAIELLLNNGSRSLRIHWLANLVDLMRNVIQVLAIQPIFHFQRMETIGKIVLQRIYFSSDNGKDSEEEIRKKEAAVGTILRWFEEIAGIGIEIRTLLGEHLIAHGKHSKVFVDLDQRQRLLWSQFDIVKFGATLAEIQAVIKSGDLNIHSRYRGGLHLIHLGASYDRVDLLEWLVLEKGIDLKLVDGSRMTALEVANDSKAAAAMEWIVRMNAKRTVSSFLRRNHYLATKKRTLKRLNDAATIIQANVRGLASRRIYSGVLLQRMEASQRFTPIWGNLISWFDADRSVASTSWTDVRERMIDIKVGLDDSMLEDTDQRLSRAMAGAVEVEINQGDDMAKDESSADGLLDDHDVNKIAQDMKISEGGELEEDDDALKAMHDDANTNQQWLSFQMTSHVVKFLQQGDKKYRSFFVRRMRQLAAGERSRILQKPLKGSKSIIYETYLEQKSGHRILWTEEKDGKIVIWYVAKHKQVSRLMHLIDDSKSRSARQQMPQAVMSELQNESYMPPQNEPRREVLLDIFNNVPLKIYDVNFNTINEIAKESWTPKLHLTDEERDIVEAEGTVLVLGRSGTGKTICICNRIEYDRQTGSGLDPLFTQLFVARSVRLCRYVEGAVGEDNRTSFTTYQRLLNDIESTLPTRQTRHFNPSQRMDFSRFRRDFHSKSSSKEKVSALISWTVIRTFLKGSIEAFQSSDGILPKDDFVEVERLGKNRCRIPLELREHVYDEFLRYQEYIKDQHLWDDCDRVRRLLLRITEAREVDPDAYEQIQRSKVYVDEVQDYTQLEILLFFYLGGPNGLFLAGDPAQSVVEGTEFRFEEIRSCGHFVGSLLQKPKTVNVNFRSHSGILNCAGGVLDLIFTHFPNSAKQLKKDDGLFQGSRPGVLSGASINQLNILLSSKLKGAVVLTHDESARHWRQQLNDYKLVYGIREAKGLEFKTVILLDFFREIPSSLQKPWRELVLGRVIAQDEFEYKHPLVCTLLKLLYTGVTRCIEQLFFVETESSTAGDATSRWLMEKDSAFATRNSIENIEAMTMTSDEFVSEGINNAELAQSVELDQAQLLLERAIWCFEQADNKMELAAKARIHHSSLSLRLELQPPYDEMNENDSVVIEMRAAHLMESLAKEGLLFELTNTFASLEPFLSDYTKEEVKKNIIRKLKQKVG